MNATLKKLEIKEFSEADSSISFLCRICHRKIYSLSSISRFLNCFELRVSHLSLKQNIETRILPLLNYSKVVRRHKEVQRRKSLKRYIIKKKNRDSQDILLR